jgi:uncharacterized protein YjiS (DUF1127 family)
MKHSVVQSGSIAMLTFRVLPIATNTAGGSSRQSASNTSRSVWTVIVLPAVRRAGFVVERSIRFCRDYYLSMHELDGLSDHDLRDLRVNRREICRIARKEALRQQARSQESR